MSGTNDSTREQASQPEPKKEMSLTRRVFAVSSVALVTQVFQGATKYIETLMLSHQDHAQQLVSASGFFSPVRSFTAAGSVAVTFALFPIVGKLYGRSKRNPELKQNIGTEVNQAYWPTLGVSMLMVGVNLVLAGFPDVLISDVLGQNKEVSKHTSEFLFASAGGLPAAALMGAQQNFFLATENYMPAIVLSFARSALELGLAGTFLYGAQLGATGLGLAALIQPWVAFIGCSLYLYRSKLSSEYGFSDNLWPNHEKMREIWRVGWPIAVQLVVELSARVGFAAWAGNVGANDLALYQIMSQYALIVSMAILAIAKAPRMLVGQMLRNATDARRIYDVNRKTLVIGGAITLTALGVYSIVPQFTSALTDVYMSHFHVTSKASLIEKSKVSFPLMGVVGCLFALRDIFSASLSGTRKTKPALAASLIGMWLIGIPLAGLFSGKSRMGLNGVLLAQSLGLLTGAVICIYKWYQYAPQAIAKSKEGPSAQLLSDKAAASSVVLADPSQVRQAKPVGEPLL